MNLFIISKDHLSRNIPGQACKEQVIYWVDFLPAAENPVATPSYFYDSKIQDIDFLRAYLVPFGLDHSIERLTCCWIEYCICVKLNGVLANCYNLKLRLLGCNCNYMPFSTI